MVRVAVVGCGRLGTKVVIDLLYHGHEVFAYDYSQETRNHLNTTIDNSIKRFRRDSLLYSPKYTGTLTVRDNLINCVTNCQFVFELISEDLAKKQSLFTIVSQYARSDAIVATSSLTLSVDAIFAQFAKPQRCLRVRFVHPVIGIDKVEVELGKFTTQETLNTMGDFLATLKKNMFFRLN